MRTWVAFVAGAALAASPGPLEAASDVPDERNLTVAAGIKAGFIPPIFATAELVLHAPHVLLGAFGIYTNGGMGNGGSRHTLGAELGFELNGPGQSTPYLLGSWFRYETAPDGSGSFERMEAATVTGGCELKGKHAEVQLGLGALFLLKDETHCTGWFCLGMHPAILPALELGARYRF